MNESVQISQSALAGRAMPAAGLRMCCERRPSVLSLRRLYSAIEFTGPRSGIEPGNRRAGLSGIVMTVDVERKTLETHVSCGLAGSFCSYVGATSALSGRQNHVPLG